MTTEEAKELCLTWLMAGEQWLRELRIEEDEDGGTYREYHTAWRPRVIRADRLDDGNHREVSLSLDGAESLCCIQYAADVEAEHTEEENRDA